MRKSRKVLVLVAALGLLLSLSGITYAYLRVRKGQETSNDLSTLRCLGVDFEDKTSNISMNNAYAVSDEEGMKTPAYTFKITNKCNTIIYAKVNLETLEVEKMLGLNHVKVWFDHENLDSPKLATLNNESVFGREAVTLDAAIQSNNLTEVNLGAYESTEFELRLWIDEETTAEEGMDKNYSAKVTVSISPNPNTSVAKGDLTMYAYIDGVISSTFPTSENYNVTTKCNSYNGSVVPTVKAVWNSEWIVDVAGLKSGDVVCNVYFTKKSESEVEAPNGWYSAEEGTLLAAIRRDNILGTPATPPGSEVSTSTEAVLASTADDYGTSYYFRGNVQNNYVVFANMCWRIVRVTGNGAIKLILYNRNDNNLENPCNEIGSELSFAKYDGTNYTSKFNTGTLSQYVGYMYGQTSSSSSFATTHANNIDSIILTNLKTWYDLKLRDYNDILADTIWCNDKSTTNSGTGTSETYFAGLRRVATQAGACYFLVGGTGPSMVCPDVSEANGGKNLSKFTANDLVNGNGKLRGINGVGTSEYKIGLLTSDEAAFAGERWQTENSNNYLYNNASSYWWLLTPFWQCTYSSTSEAIVQPDGSLSTVDNEQNFGVRPAISLISTIQISSGTGTYLEPYRIIVDY